jgi:predicted dehydrogenase
MNTSRIPSSLDRDANELPLVPRIESLGNLLREKPSIAVVGFGRMGLLHSTILSLLGIRIDAVVDSSHLLRFAMARVMKNIAFYGELNDLFRKQAPDIVYVTTPTTSHCHVLTDLIRGGIRHIFLEKPPAVTSEELLEVLGMLNRNHIAMVGFQKRYALTFTHAKSLLDEGAIGKPTKTHAIIRSNAIATRTDRHDSIGRGVLLDLGIHLVDLLAWMLGLRQVVQANKRSVNTRVDDVFESTLVARDGSIVEFGASWSDPQYGLQPETRIEIHGSSGTITVTEDFVRVEKEGDESQGSDYCLYKPHYYQGTPRVNLADPEYTLENLHFLDCVSQESEPATSLRKAQETMRLVDEMYSKAGRDPHA